MTKKELARLAVDALKAEYPDAICSLEYQDPLQLLIATRLSAQCTDARVNLVTPGLFARFPTLEDFCQGTEEEIGELIRSCGFYNTKSKDILGMCRMIRDQFGGKVPDTIEDLTKLPGVGRKTANLILGDIYHKPAVVTDTHCIRITGRLGLTKNTAPEKVEQDLREVLPPEESNDFCHRLVLHGRAVCTARKAECEKCCMAAFCKKAGVGPNGEKLSKKSGASGTKKPGAKKAPAK
ncbi:MAG: endonuclease III [Acutalibacter sp.]|jgi:endonuclease-3